MWVWFKVIGNDMRTITDLVIVDEFFSCTEQRHMANKSHWERKVFNGLDWGWLGNSDCEKTVCFLMGYQMRAHY